MAGIDVAALQLEVERSRAARLRAWAVFGGLRAILTAAFLNNQEFVDQRPNERLRSDDFVSVRLGQLGARIADFSFKSATELGSQMVSELIESDRNPRTPCPISRELSS